MKKTKPPLPEFELAVASLLRMLMQTAKLQHVVGTKEMAIVAGHLAQYDINYADLHEPTIQFSTIHEVDTYAKATIKTLHETMQAQYVRIAEERRSRENLRAAMQHIINEDIQGEAP